MDAKISFGFKKLSKKSVIIGAKPPEEKKVELIECLDASNIKIIGHVEEEKNELVIPLQGVNKNLLDRIKEANDLKERSRIKYRRNGIKIVKGSKEKQEIKDMRPDSELTIEELAARKLIEDAKMHERRTTAEKVTTIAIEDQLILEGAKEPTMDDYESVPISDFGMAILRGMGWKEPQNKEKKRVEAPQLRPKGMGLGASMPGNTRNKIPFDKDGKELKLIKGAKARIIAGKEKDNYCIVQGLDDDAGRVIVKTTLAGTILTLNEFMLFPVSEKEYGRMSKVINTAKFEKYTQNSTHQLKEERRSVKDGDDSDVEYVPNDSDIKIEVLSESETEKIKLISQNKIRLKEERRSRSKSKNRHRSKSPEKSRSKSHKNSRSYDRNKELSKERSKSDSRERTKSKQRRHLSRRTRTRSRSSSRERTNKRHDRSRSRSRSKDYRKEKCSRNKSSRSDKYSESDSDSSSEGSYRQRREKKPKKSKKHKAKKDKKLKKEKKKSKRRNSSYSDTDSSNSRDNKKSSRT